MPRWWDEVVSVVRYIGSVDILNSVISKVGRPPFPIPSN